MKTIIPILFNNVKKLSTCKSNGAICWPKPSYGPMETHRSELMNGIKIVAAKTSGAVMAACTIMFQAGSRYESPDFFGATHFLRAASSGSGCCYTAFSKLRVLQQRGAYLTCSSDRQSISYTLRCPLPYFADLKYYLLDTAARCCYHDWEISDRKPLVRDDLARMNPEERVIDLIQKAFWAGPLANSIYCEDERIDDMSGELLNNYVNTYFKSTNCCVASVGIPFEETMMLADKIDTRRERPVLKPHPKSRPRSGFEYYDLGSGSDTWIAVAVPGCGTDDITNLYKQAIIASACGTGNVQQGQHELDRIPQPPLGFMSGDDIFTNFRAFNISYADTGIFGIIAKTRSETANRTAYAVAEFLSNVGDLDFKQIQDGKKRLLLDSPFIEEGYRLCVISLIPIGAESTPTKSRAEASLRIKELDLAIHEEDCVKVVEGFALQLANDVRIDSLQESLNMIDTISLDEVKATAMCLARSSNEMAVAVVGDLSVVPNDQEILKK